MNQLVKVINFINTNGSITDDQARHLLGVGRLASRICDLKKADYKIKTELIKVRNRDGSFSRVARYSWAKEEGAAI